MFLSQETPTLEETILNGQFDNVEFCIEAEEFLDRLNEKTRTKVYYNIRKVQHIQDEKLFKKLDGDIWEFRTLYRKERIRLFAFRHPEGDIETVVVTTHGIIKKTSKIPRKEILKAKEIRKEFLNSKKK